LPLTPVRNTSRELIPSSVIAVAILLFTEVMIFASLISTYIVLHGKAVAWAPLGQPRLPVIATAFNTSLLVLSGVTMSRTVRALAGGNHQGARRLMSWSFALGAGFVVLQGVEWARLVHFGLTTSSSLYGSLFYTLVGFHALHVVAALIALAWTMHATGSDPATPRSRARLRAMRMYWTFVVAAWPPLYAVVYLW
jgi:heme/copper-type cytochrome/quinol oxidase subunit 3